MTGSERALTQLQRLVRETEVSAAKGNWRKIPDDLQTAEARGLVLAYSEQDAMNEAKSTLRDDHRFEYLDDRALDNAVWRFVCLASLQSEDHVPWFAAEYAREPWEDDCWCEVEGLTVSEPIEIGSVVVVSGDDPRVPTLEWFTDPVDSFVRVGVRGTDSRRMVESARVEAVHALRVLRLSLSRHRFIPELQLRFRLGVGCRFGNGGWSTTRDPSRPVDLTVSPKLLAELPSGLLTLNPLHVNDMEKRALRALDWFDRGMTATDPLIRLLFHFFGLEALLSSRDTRTKDRVLAWRRLVLARESKGSFTHPAVVYWLYDKVRSAAVHGSEPPKIRPSDAAMFEWDTQEAVREYLDFARSRGLTKRFQVLRAIDDHEEANEVLEWLQQNDEGWETFVPPYSRSGNAAT
jgi:hypothetical protein